MLERIFQEPKFRVCCLGAIKLVEAGSGTDMTPTSRKTRALLGYLCIVGKPVGRERLASLLWGDRGDEQARASLRQAIYELRSLLGGDNLLKVERDTIAAGDDVGTDIAEILAAAQSGDLEQLGQSLSEWRGDFFEELPSIDPTFDSWLQSERPRVLDSLVAAVTEAAKAGMAKGEIDPARKVVGLLQQHDGTNEVVLRLALKLDHLAGDSAALHRRYERFRELLRSDLGAAPAAETRRLFDELATISSAPDLSVSSSSNSNTAEDMNACAQYGDEPGPAKPVPSFIAQATAGTDVETRLSHSPIRSGQWFKLGAVLFVIVFLSVLAWVIWNHAREAASSRQEPFLAVMPFQDLGADPQSRDFSSRISREIAEALLQTTKIHVAAAPSSLRLPNADSPAATHVLSGSVERAGSRIHIIAQLMDIADDRVVWGHAYDETMSQIPGSRRDIAAQIAGALGKLLSSDSFSAAPMGSAAYEHYLKGRSLFRRNDSRGAVAELEAATGVAPDFANAWATLGAARLRLAMDARDPSMAGAARAAAQRAIALDSNNGEAQGVLAMLIPATRLSEIDRMLDRALRADPYNAQLLGWRGEFLMFVGRNHEALDALTRAFVLDRETPGVAPNLVLASLKSGRLERAGEILDLMNRSRDNRLRTGLTDLRLKYFLYRMDWFGMATWLSALPDRLSPPVAAFLRLCRETATALATRDTDKFVRLRAGWRTESSFDPDAAVQFLSALGDVDGALAVVQSAVTSRRNEAFLTDPEWEALFVPDLVPLRSDPRVPVLLAQWGLSEFWRATNHPPDYTR